jgi:hypothetical protein
MQRVELDDLAAGADGPAEGVTGIAAGRQDLCDAFYFLFCA